MYHKPITSQIDIWGGRSSGSRAGTLLIKSQNQSSLHGDDGDDDDGDDGDDGDDDDNGGGSGDDYENGQC